MENAQLISLSRQMALQRQMDVVANNLANINTSGFKSESLLFEEYLSPVARDEDPRSADDVISFTDGWATLHDFTNGSIVDTGNPLDVAIDGDAFLTVETPAGERWSRGGALQIDATGYLVDLNGYRVLSETGPIRFEPTETDFAIGANGGITTPQGSKGRLKMVDFEDQQDLLRDGGNLFSGGGEPIPATGFRVIQGAIERSNVSGVTEMSDMVTISRAYQTLATLMQQQQELRRSAIQRLGSLSA